MCLVAKFSFQLHGYQCVCEGRRGSIRHTGLRSVGTLMAGPDIFFCLPVASVTIFMNGIRREINRVSSLFRFESSGGISARPRLLAFACAGILPRIRVRWQVLQIHTSWFTLRRRYCVLKTLSDVALGSLVYFSRWKPCTDYWYIKR